MKAQYFGDVNDYRKFALLRLLADVGRFKIGVCWLLTPDEGSKREYLKEPGVWRGFDPDLFDMLLEVDRGRPTSGLDRIEQANAVAGALFFNELTPGGAEARQSFHKGCMKALAAADLVFFDPDNGLATDAGKPGSANARKYVRLEEIADHYAAGSSVLVYQHFPRVERTSFLESVAGRLRAQCDGAAVIAFPTAHAAFLLVARPEHTERVEAVRAAVAGRMVPGLFDGAKTLVADGLNAIVP
ncbi:MAG: hypothetical protein KGM42_20980 [Hyphomicrobiales bacterium]|nr:hypothetical protein [Hyphomicrobiales bacterium]